MPALLSVFQVVLDCTKRTLVFVGKLHLCHFAVLVPNGLNLSRSKHIPAAFAGLPELGLLIGAFVTLLVVAPVALYFVFSDK